MSKSLGNHIGVTEPPSEIYGRTLRIPDERIAPWASLVLGEDPPAGLRAARRQALAGARARRALPLARGGGGGRERAFDRVHIAHELPEEIEDAVVAAGGRHGAPARGDRRRPSGARGRTRGAASPRAACGSTARSSTDARRARRRRSTGASSSSASGTSAACGWPDRGCEMGPPAAPGAAVRTRTRGQPAGRRGTLESAPAVEAARPAKCRGPLQVQGAALHSTARSGRPEHAPRRRSPLRPKSGATVFENSTACAPIGLTHRPNRCASRFDPGAGARPRGGRARRQARNQAVPRRCARTGLCVLAVPRVARRQTHS